MWNLKRNDADELTYKTESHPDLENEVKVAEGCDSSGVWEGHVYPAVFKMGNQQGPTV